MIKRNLIFIILMESILQIRKNQVIKIKNLKLQIINGIIIILIINQIKQDLMLLPQQGKILTEEEKAKQFKVVMEGNTI